MSLEAPEVREGSKVLDVGIQTLGEARIVGKDDQDVTGVLEETAFAQGR